MALMAVKYKHAIFALARFRVYVKVGYELLYSVLVVGPTVVRVAYGGPL